jgi:hypothetical protein
MMAKNEVLVKAGIIAAQKWDIDPKLGAIDKYIGNLY